MRTQVSTLTGGDIIYLMGIMLLIPIKGACFWRRPSDYRKPVLLPII